MLCSLRHTYEYTVHIGIIPDNLCSLYSVSGLKRRGGGGGGGGGIEHHEAVYALAHRVLCVNRVKMGMLHPPSPLLGDTLLYIGQWAVVILQYLYV